MEVKALNDDADDATGIYFYDSYKIPVKVSSIFNIDIEDEGLRVKTDMLKYLFRRITDESFNEIYNAFLKRLNFNFSSFCLNKSLKIFSEFEKTSLQQKMICDLIYFYTTNNFKRILIKRDDFVGTFQVMSMVSFIKELYLCNHIDSLQIAAHVYRLTPDEILRIDENYENYCSLY